MAFSVKLGTGTYTDDITDSILASSMNISDSMQVGGDTMSFSAYIRNREYAIRAGIEIQVYDSITQLASPVNSSVGSLIVNSTNGIFVGDIVVINNIEHVKVLNISGSILEVERGMGSTYAVNHSNGVSISTILFGGNVVSVNTHKENNSNITIHDVSARDYVWMLDRRFLNKLYGEKASATGVKRSDAGADADDEGMIEEILYDLRNDAK